MEVTEQKFFENTKGTCLFCRTKVESLEQVGEFDGEFMFICTDCLTEPNAQAVVA